MSLGDSPDRTKSLRARLAVCVIAAVATGCPVTQRPTRDGGTPCATSSECNPTGVRCGAVFLCVQNFCARTSTLVACADGAYPDAAFAGNCLTYEDCNPLPRCGAVVNCVSFRCDPDGPRIEIPCRDGGAVDGAADARTDVADANADARDARVDDAVDAGPDVPGDGATPDATPDGAPDATPDGAPDATSDALNDDGPG